MCLIALIQCANFIHLEESLVGLEATTAIEATTNNIAKEGETGGMESNNAANSSKTYGVLRDIDLDENYSKTEPSRKTINTKGKKRMVEGELIRCVIASMNSADFMRLDELPFQVKPKAWDENGPKFKLEFHDPAAPEPSQAHKNLSQGQENTSNDQKNEKLDSALDTEDFALCVWSDVDVDAGGLEYIGKKPSHNINNSSNGVPRGKALIQSFPNFVINVKTPVQWVSNRSMSKLCNSTKPEPTVLNFWIIGCISKLFLNALRQYEDSYAVELNVTNDELDQLHKWMEAGPYPEKIAMWRNPLRMKARYVDVAKTAEAMEPSDLLGVNLPLPKKANYPLIFKGAKLTEDSNRPKRDEDLEKLDDKPFVAMLVEMGAYKVNNNFGYNFTFKNIYMLGDKAMWREEIEAKGCGMVETAALRQRSKKFGPMG